MPKTGLFNHFKPAEYSLEQNGDLFHLTITGQKLAPPSRRISLHQSSLKITGAKVIRFDKHGPAEIEISRINHLPNIQQVRLHSPSMMYPGRYQIELNYRIKPEKLATLSDQIPSRELLPSIDEAEAWQTAKFEFRQ